MHKLRIKTSYLFMEIVMMLY